MQIVCHKAELVIEDIKSKKLIILLTEGQRSTKYLSSSVLCAEVNRFGSNNLYEESA